MLPIRQIDEYVCDGQHIFVEIRRAPDCGEPVPGGHDPGEGASKARAAAGRSPVDARVREHLYKNLAGARGAAPAW